MNTDYKDIFSMGGPLARALPDYAYRPEQAVMAKAVGAALARLEPLIVEAGTGTGKTFAYLIPALLSGRSVIISTGTRTLQDQLFRRDVPMLAKALGLPAKLALLKGRTNYLCRHRLELATQQDLIGPERNVARLLAQGFALGCDHQDGRPRRTHGPAGAVADFAEHYLHARKLSRPGVSAVFTLPRRSKRAVMRRRPISSSSIIIYCSLTWRSRTRASEILLPGAEAVILDEAHQVPDIAAQFFGQTWSVRQVQVLMRDITAELAAAAIRAPAVVEAVLGVDGQLEGLRFALAARSRALRVVGAAGYVSRRPAGN